MKTAARHVCGLRGTQESRSQPGHEKGSPAAAGVPGAESRGQHALYWPPGGTATRRLGGWAPSLEMGTWSQENWTASFSASSKQDNAFLYQEIPLGKGKQKAETIFTAN